MASILTGAQLALVHPNSSGFEGRLVGHVFVHLGTLKLALNLGYHAWFLLEPPYPGLEIGTALLHLPCC